MSVTEANWVRHSVHLGIVGVHQSFRRFRQNQYRVWLFGLATIGLGISFGGMGVLYAVLLRSLEGPFSIPGGVRLGVSILWVFAVWFFSQQALMYWRRPTAEAFVLTTVSTRTIVVGMLLTEFLTAWLSLVPLTVLLVCVIGYAFLSPTILLLIPLSVCLFAGSTIVVGYVFGFAYLFVTAQSRRLTNYQNQLLVQLAFLTIVVYLVVQSFGRIPAVWEITTFKWLPTSWFADIAVYGTPVRAPLDRALAGVLGSLVTISAGGFLVIHLAGAYWMTDRGSTTSGDGKTTTGSQSPNETLAASISPFVIPGFVSQPTQRVAQIVLLRLRRTPRRLLFLFSVSISFVIYLGFLHTQFERSQSLVPIVCLLFFPWFAGVTFGLNPLGDEGSVLPATLTSSVSGQQYVRGLMLPGLLYSLPLTLLCVFVGNIISAYSLGIQTGFVISSVILNVVAVALAPAIGMRIPRFSSSMITQSDEIMPPSMTAIFVYTLAVGLLGGGVLFVLLAPINVYELIINESGLVKWVRLGCVVGWLGITLAIARVGYNDAIRKFEQYTVY